MAQVFFTPAEAAAATGGEWRGPEAPNVTGVFTDTRDPEPGSLFIALRGKNFDAHDYLDKAVECGAAALCIEKDLLAKAPGKIPLLLVENTLDAWQSLAAWHRLRFPQLKVAAVTGSVGKTSVKEMLKAVFIEASGDPAKVMATLENTNNQVGVPLNLFRLDKEHLFAVLELGSDFNGEIEPLSRIVRADTAVVNSIAPCHLESFRDLIGVAREKSHVFDGVPDDGNAVIPTGCAGEEILRKSAGIRRIYSFGADCHSDFFVTYHGGGMLESSFTLTFPDRSSYEVKWHLSGAHQALNAAAAAAVAFSLGITPEVIVAGLANTSLPGMRSRITGINGTTFINDAYNANPASMKSAFDYLASFAEPEKLVLVLGGMREQGEDSARKHLALVQEAMERFPGAEMILIGDEFRDAVPPTASYFRTAGEAAAAVAAAAGSGKIVFVKGSRGNRLEDALPPEAR